MSMGIEPFHRNNIWALDRQRIREMVYECVDFKEILDRPLSVIEMGELGLVTGCPIDCLLQSVETANPIGTSRGKI